MCAAAASIADAQMVGMAFCAMFHQRAAGKLQVTCFEGRVEPCRTRLACCIPADFGPEESRVCSTDMSLSAACKE